MTQQLGSGQSTCRVGGIIGKINMNLRSEQTQTTQNYNPACQPSNVFTETTQHSLECRIEHLPRSLIKNCTLWASQSWYLCWGLHTENIFFQSQFDDFLFSITGNFIICYCPIQCHKTMSTMKEVPVLAQFVPLSLDPILIWTSCAQSSPPAEKWKLSLSNSYQGPLIPSPSYNLSPPQQSGHACTNLANAGLNSYNQSVLLIEDDCKYNKIYGK